MIDASIVRAHQHAAGGRGGQCYQALGRSCGGLSSKIHAKVDSFGMPVKFIITGGERQECTQANALIGEDHSDYLLADRAYDQDELRDNLHLQGTTPVIPGKKNRKITVEYDKHIYKERNIIERFFNRIKHFRRIATRYDKTVLMFMGGLTVVSILLWLKF